MSPEKVVERDPDDAQLIINIYNKFLNLKEGGELVFSRITLIQFTTNISGYDRIQIRDHSIAKPSRGYVLLTMDSNKRYGLWN